MVVVAKEPQRWVGKTIQNTLADDLINADTGNAGHGTIGIDNPVLTVRNPHAIRHRLKDVLEEIFIHVLHHFGSSRKIIWRLKPPRQR